MNLKPRGASKKDRVGPKTFFAVHEVLRKTSVVTFKVFSFRA